MVDASPRCGVGCVASTLAAPARPVASGDPPGALPRLGPCWSDASASARSSRRWSPPRAWARAARCVLTGEAGIGKSALLEDAAAAVADAGMRVLRAAGVEAEREVPFGGLLQLLRPVLDQLDAIPAPQAEALGSALALRARVRRRAVRGRRRDAQPAQPGRRGRAARGARRRRPPARPAVGAGAVLRGPTADRRPGRRPARGPRRGAVGGRLGRAAGARGRRAWRTADAASLAGSARAPALRRGARRGCSRRPAATRSPCSSSPTTGVDALPPGAPVPVPASLARTFARRADALSAGARTALLVAAAGGRRPRRDRRGACALLGVSVGRPRRGRAARSCSRSTPTRVDVPARPRPLRHLRRGRRPPTRRAVHAALAAGGARRRRRPPRLAPRRGDGRPRTRPSRTCSTTPRPAPAPAARTPSRRPGSSVRRGSPRTRPTARSGWSRPRRARGARACPTPRSTCSTARPPLPQTAGPAHPRRGARRRRRRPHRLGRAGARRAASRRAREPPTTTRTRRSCCSPTAILASQFAGDIATAAARRGPDRRARAADRARRAGSGTMATAVAGRPGRARRARPAARRRWRRPTRSSTTRSSRPGSSSARSTCARAPSAATSSRPSSRTPGAARDIGGLPIAAVLRRPRPGDHRPLGRRRRRLHRGDPAGPRGRAVHRRRRVPGRAGLARGARGRRGRLPGARRGGPGARRRAPPRLLPGVGDDGAGRARAGPRARRRPRSTGYRALDALLTDLGLVDVDLSPAAEMVEALVHLGPRRRGAAPWRRR